jgi:hypothetical protein
MSSAISSLIKPYSGSNAPISGGKLELVLGPGVYYISHSINIEWGRPERLIIRAEAAGSVVIRGDHMITADAKKSIVVGPTLAAVNAKSGILTLRADPAELASIEISESLGDPFPRAISESALYQDGVRLEHARWPANGYAQAAGGATDQLRLPANIQGAPINLGDGAFWVEGFLGSKWRYQRIKGHLAANLARTVILDRPEEYPIHPKDRFALVGSPGLIVAEGQYSTSSTWGGVLVWPLNGRRKEFSFSMVDSAMLISNSNNVRVEGIVFSYFRADTIVIHNSTDISVSACSIKEAGRRGVVIDGGARVSLGALNIIGTGEEALWIWAGNRGSLLPSEVVVVDSLIEDFSWRLRSSRPAIYVNGVGVEILHNIIRRGPFDAIVFRGNNHVIYNNTIIDVDQDCSDCGAIYTGRDWTSRGTIVSHNNICKGKLSREADTNGIYLDDLASGIRVVFNKIVGFPLGIKIGGGRDNTVSNNIILDLSLGGVRMDNRGQNWMAKQVGDANSEIRLNLAAVPYSGKLYDNAYPHMANILSDEPGAPKYNTVSGNIHKRYKYVYNCGL